MLTGTGSHRLDGRAARAHENSHLKRNPRYDRQMALYVIERNFAEQLDLSDDDVNLIEEVNGDEGVRWLFSFLSADKRRTYCLYEAPSPEAIHAAARKADVPVSEIVEVGAGTPQFSDRLRKLADTLG
jgi:hypothetical protein